jgi:phosphatidylglycerophosphatase C
MQKFAFYDLDRTILSTPTFTLFLYWAAATDKPWRLLLTPIWLLLAIGYTLKLTDRGGFKPAAIRLFLGSDMSQARMAKLAQRFADWRIPADVAPGAAKAIARDRAEGYRLIMATAAPEFYAQALGDKLGFEAVIASRHLRAADGAWSPQIDGDNCYGAEKGRRVAAWLAAQKIEGLRHIRAYSDHPSDASLFALADESVLVGRSAKLASLAQREGWTLSDFSVR